MKLGNWNEIKRQKELGRARKEIFPFLCIHTHYSLWFGLDVADQVAAQNTAKWFVRVFFGCDLIAWYSQSRKIDNISYMTGVKRLFFYLALFLRCCWLLLLLVTMPTKYNAIWEKERYLLFCSIISFLCFYFFFHYSCCTFIVVIRHCFSFNVSLDLNLYCWKTFWGWIFCFFLLFYPRFFFPFSCSILSFIISFICV